MVNGCHGDNLLSVFPLWLLYFYAFFPDSSMREMLHRSFKKTKDQRKNLVVWNLRFFYNLPIKADSASFIRLSSLIPVFSASNARQWSMIVIGQELCSRARACNGKTRKPARDPSTSIRNSDFGSHGSWNWIKLNLTITSTKKLNHELYNSRRKKTRWCCHENHLESGKTAMRNKEGMSNRPVRTDGDKLNRIVFIVFFLVYQIGSSNLLYSVLKLLCIGLRKCRKLTG